MKLLVVPGDGIGPEITDAAVKALGALNERFKLDIELDYADSGLAGLKKHGTTVRDEDIARALAADGVILGPASVHDYPPPSEGGVNVPAAYRGRLDLYANIRPCYTREGVPSVAKKMDLIFVRENLEDFYTDRNMFVGPGEFMPTPDTVIAMGKITAQGSRRIARTAFEIARRRPRKKVTIVHKVPVMKLYHKLFLDEARKVAADYPDVQVEDMMVDACAAHLIRTPERFDVILTTNVFGDILSDEAAELAGSLGLAASLNHGDKASVAQAGHGSAPDIAGKDLANPSSLMQSTAMLLDHLGARTRSNSMIEAARVLNGAVDAMLTAAATRTRDLGGELGTRAFADKVVRHILDARN